MKVQYMRYLPGNGCWKGNCSIKIYSLPQLGLIREGYDWSFL